MRLFNEATEPMILGDFCDKTPDK